MTILTLKNAVHKVIDGGTYTGVKIIGGRGVVLRNVTITPPPATNINDQALRIVNCPGVLVEGCTITGQAATTGVAIDAPGPAGLVKGLWAGEGIRIEGCPGGIIRRCVVTRFHQGIAFGKQDNLTIEHCTIANVRTSPLVGVAGNDLHIIGNGIGASFPWRWGETPAGDHADRIHVWSAGGDTTGLVITDNVLDDGKGVAILGIFVQNKDGNFNGATIERNTISSGQTLAMMLTGVNGSVSFNTLVALNPKKPASIYASLGCSGVWQGNTGGKGVVFNRKLTAAQRALVVVTP